ncbi:MAG: 4Fe-4S binding protein [Phycisphaerae bacterium]|nr:4Fe-4S binding protein [Phycisphaerae bacterium]
MAATVDVEKCTGCGACVDVCPVEAITLNDEKAAVDQENCTDCAVCVAECPTEAISVPE